MAKFFVVLATLVLVAVVFAEEEVIDQEDDGSSNGIMGTLGVLQNTASNVGQLVISLPNTLLQLVRYLGLGAYIVGYQSGYFVLAITVGKYGLLGESGPIGLLFWGLANLISFLFGENALLYLLQNGFFSRISTFVGTLLNSLAYTLSFVSTDAGNSIA